MGIPMKWIKFNSLCIKLNSRVVITQFLMDNPKIIVWVNGIWFHLDSICIKGNDSFDGPYVLSGRINRIRDSSCFVFARYVRLCSFVIPDCSLKFFVALISVP